MYSFIKIMLVVIVSIFTLSGIIYAYVHFFVAAPVYKGPKSDHFDGTRFYNPEPVEEKELVDVIRWLITREKGDWNQIEEQPLRQPLPSSYVENDAVRITFINHATLLIQVNEQNIITDPIYSERASPFKWAGPKRVRKPGLKFEDLPPIHLVLISHNHYDHLDISTLKRLAERDNPKMLVPLGVGLLLQKHHLHNYVEMDWWQRSTSQGGSIIHCVPAQHFSGRGLTDRYKTLWAGYVVEHRSKTLYFAGDTGYGSFFKTIAKAFPSIDLAMLPIGAYKPEWFMSPVHTSPFQAVQAHLDLRAEKTIPIHYHTFPMADEGMKEPLQDLFKAIDDKNLNSNDFIILKEGEFYEF